MLGAAGAAWLTPLAAALARQQESAPRGVPAKSVIVLWMQGGPSQLETFDPHAGSEIARGTQSIKTSAPGVELAANLERLAEQMHRVALVRSVTSKEGDHERATYNAKTGFRPVPALVHPSLGAVLCHQLRDRVEIPRHVSILPTAWAARGGYLGDQYDAFKIGDPRQPIPDVRARVSKDRFDRRVKDLFDVAETEFSRGRLRNLDRDRTLHGVATRSALQMMTSEQLQAFDVSLEPQSVREQYGDTPFGRGCLAAARLVETGVRCVEVTLDGWDTHVNNHELQAGRAAILDPAMAALLADLDRRGLLDSTVVVCGGEFGRTPRINPAGGRDHWPHGFTVALAGGGIRGGAVYGETNPRPNPDGKENLAENVAQPRNIADIHATILHAVGVDFTKFLDTPVGRPMIISEGSVIREVLT